MRRALASAAVVALCLVVAPSYAATAEVNVVGFQYAPSGYATADPLGVGGTNGVVTLPMDATVPVVHYGDRVNFTNRDPVPHTVTWASGPRPAWAGFQLDGGGGARAITITNATAFPAGLYVYKCSIHAGMRGAFRVH